MYHRMVFVLNISNINNIKDNLKLIVAVSQLNKK